MPNGMMIVIMLNVMGIWWQSFNYLEVLYFEFQFFDMNDLLIIIGLMAKCEINGMIIVAVLNVIGVGL